MDDAARILLVDSDSDGAAAIAGRLRQAGYIVQLARTPFAALELIEQEAPFDLLLTDLCFGPGKPHGLSLALMARHRRPGLACVFIAPAEIDAEAQGAAPGPIVRKTADLERLPAVIRAELARAKAGGA
jgi:CheY-like chemotaxis protein